MLDNIPPHTLGRGGGRPHPRAHGPLRQTARRWWSRGACGRYFSIIDLAVDPVEAPGDGGQEQDHPLVPICEKVDEKSLGCNPKSLKERSDVKLVQTTFMGEPVVLDDGMTALMAPALARVEELSEPAAVGFTAAAQLAGNYEAESALGAVLADALREREKADLRAAQPGGPARGPQGGRAAVRRPLRGDPLRQHGGHTVTMSYEELRRVLTAAYGSRKGVFQVSGLKITAGEVPQRVDAARLHAGERPSRSSRTRSTRW